MDHVTDQGLTFADVSRLTGWHELATLRRLTGKVRLSGEDIEKLAEVLKRPIEALYRGLREARAS
jgi:cyanate lyase